MMRSTFGRKSTVYSVPWNNSMCPFCLPKPLVSITLNPVNPRSLSACLTSSSLNGLRVAMTVFMAFSSKMFLQLALRRKTMPHPYNNYKFIILKLSYAKIYFFRTSTSLSIKMRNRQFEFSPKLQYRLTTERLVVSGVEPSEAAPSSLRFPVWCSHEESNLDHKLRKL